MLIAFIIAALSDIATTYIGGKRGYGEANQLLKFGPSGNAAVQLLVYSAAGYMAHDLGVPLWNWLLLIAIPGVSAVRNYLLMRGH